MAQWFINLAGVDLGLVDDQQLRKLARSGRLLPDDLVCKPGLMSPVRASRVRGLFSSRPDCVNPPAFRSLVTFSDWYELHPGRWPAWTQVIAWLFYGFLWIPGWWGLDLIGAEDDEVRQFGRRVLEIVGCLALVVLVAITLKQRHRDQIELPVGRSATVVTAKE